MASQGEKRGDKRNAARKETCTTEVRMRVSQAWTAVLGSGRTPAILAMANKVQHVEQPVRREAALTLSR